MKGKTLCLLFSLCAGVVLGSLLESVTAQVNWLSWLNYGQHFGIGGPAVLNLGIITFTVGLDLHLTVGTVLCIVLALLLSRKLCK